MSRNEALRINRDEMITQLLLPDENLETVAAAWGITRQRVDQIFQKRTGRKIKEVKEELFEAAGFSCKYCGTKISRNIKPYGRTMCSRRCHELYIRYDVDHPLKCDECLKEYIPFRNKGWQGGLNVNYCSMNCYVEAREKAGILSTKRGTYISRRPVITKVCLGCKKDYETRTADQRYCTFNCWKNNQSDVLKKVHARKRSAFPSLFKE